MQHRGFMSLAFPWTLLSGPGSHQKKRSAAHGRDVWITEHHFSEYGGTVPNPPAFLASVARHWRPPSRRRPGALPLGDRLADCFASWLDQLRANDETLVFVGLNAPFDWSFVNYYFHKFLGKNPFGFSALDIKAYYMGATGCQWADTRSSRMAAALNPQLSGDHKALHDAQYQAEIFRLIQRNLGAH